MVVIRGFGPNTQQLEKHLDDYRKGKARLSTDVAAQVKKEGTDNAVKLSLENPDRALEYLAYQTTQPYTKRARYVRALSTIVNNAVPDGKKSPKIG